MRTKHQKFTLAAALVAALALGGQAFADCGANPGVISTAGAGGTSQIWTTAFSSDPSFFYGSYGGTTSCGAYNGCTPVSGGVEGQFWAQGTGDVAIGVGNDNGAFDLVAVGGITFASFPSYGYYGGATFFNVGWQPGTDGCIGASNCLCMLLTDHDGANSYYAIMGAQSSTTFTTSFDQGGVDGSGNFNAPIVMVPVGAPSIDGSARVGTDVELTVSVGPQGGVYMKNGCNCGPTGYKVLQQIVPRGNMPPSDRSTGWSEAPLAGGGAQPVSAIGAQVTIGATCGAADQDVYLATQLFFDSGFSTSVVSGNSSRVECGTTLADPDDKPRQRPGAIKPTPNQGRGGRGR